MTARNLFVPALLGGAVVFAIRLIFADLMVGLVGIVAYALVLGLLLVLARALGWRGAPAFHAAVAAIGVTIAFIAVRQTA